MDARHPQQSESSSLFDSDFSPEEEQAGNPSTEPVGSSSASENNGEQQRYSIDPFPDAAEARRQSSYDEGEGDNTSARAPNALHYYPNGILPPYAQHNGYGYEYTSGASHPYSGPYYNGAGESREEGEVGSSSSTNHEQRQHMYSGNPVTAGHPPEAAAAASADSSANHSRHQEIPAVAASASAEETAGASVSMAEEASYQQYHQQQQYLHYQQYHGMTMAYPPYMPHSYHHHPSEQQYHHNHNDYAPSPQGMLHFDMYAQQQHGHHHAPPYYQYPYSGGGMGYNPYYGQPHNLPPPQAAGQGMVDPASLDEPATSASSSALSDAPKEPPKKKAKSRKGQKKDGKPKRPLSAYNLFFQDERAKMLREIGLLDDGNGDDGGGGKKEAAGKDQDRKPRKTGIGFAEMARTISKKWKSIDAETLSKYKKKADEDMKRYRGEMEVFNQRRDDNQQEEPPEREHETNNEDDDVS